MVKKIAFLSQTSTFLNDPKLLNDSVNVYWYVYVYTYIYPQNIWGIGNYADNYIDGSNNLTAILKLIYPLKKKRTELLSSNTSHIVQSKHPWR
jgi:hypothetical protein